jgi:hypothetical protein
MMLYANSNYMVPALAEKKNDRYEAVQLIPLVEVTTLTLAKQN